MGKTMSIRMDRENFEFLNELTKEQRSDLSKAVRDMVTRGRILLAVERYKKGQASLGRAAELPARTTTRVTEDQTRVCNGRVETDNHNADCLDEHDISERVVVESSHRVEILRHKSILFFAGFVSSTCPWVDPEPPSFVPFEYVAICREASHHLFCAQTGAIPLVSTLIAVACAAVLSGSLALALWAGWWNSRVRIRIPTIEHPPLQW